MFGNKQHIEQKSTKGKGNRTFFGSTVQTKLTVGKPGDKYEVEADRSAEQVVSKIQQKPNESQAFFPRLVNGNQTPIAQGKLQAKAETENEIQEKPLAESITPLIQRSAETDASDDDDQVQTKSDLFANRGEEEKVQKMEDDSVQEKSESNVLQREEDQDIQEKSEVTSKSRVESIEPQLKSSKGQGSPMPGPLKQQMESGFGADFSKVKIHTDSRADDMSRKIGAQAFTNKGDVYFKQGKFNPEQTEGQKLIAHELTHTIQQGAASPKKTDQEQAGNSLKDAKVSKSSPKTEASMQAESGTITPQATVKADLVLPDKKTTIEEKEKPGEKKTGKDSKAPEVKPQGGGGGGAPFIRSPKADPNFKKVVTNVGARASNQKQHEPSESLANDAQEAALSPANERESLAQADQVNTMEKQEPKMFDAKAFKALLKSRIEKMKLPANEDQASEFDKNNNIAEVNQTALGDVKGEKQNAGSAIEQSTKAAPNVGAVPERTPKQLKVQHAGPVPPSVNAKKAIPGKRPEDQISKPLNDNFNAVEDKMASNKVTDAQLERSNEPKFLETLDSKKETKKHVDTAPLDLRKKEARIRGGKGKESENLSQNDLQEMNKLRGGAMTKVLGDQKNTGEKDTAARQKVANDINQIYEQTKTDVTAILDKLDTDVSSLFTGGAALAKMEFEIHVAQKMRAYKDKRYGGAFGWASAVGDFFTGLPDEVNAFFVSGREVYIQKMDEFLTMIAELVAANLNAAKKRIIEGKQKVDTYVKELPKNLQKVGKEAAEAVNEKFAELDDQVDSKQDELVESLAQQYNDALNEVDERIKEMQEENKGLIDKLVDFVNGVIDTIKKLWKLLNELLSAISDLIDVILDDPIGFVGGLFDGIGQGIDNFKANIESHLIGGMVEWLTGSLGPTGITVPKDVFSLEGVFDLSMQAIGISWNYVRQKAVFMLGENAVKTLEGSYDFFVKVKNQKVAGLWELVQEKFTDIKETVLDALKDMLITKVIQAGVKWVLSLLIPGAGFIKAIMAIKDLIVFFVESAIALIPALIDAIRAMANGSVALVAKSIEFGLGKIIPVVINLFARLLGLSDLAKKAREIFSKIRRRIDGIITKLIAKAKVHLRKLVASGKAKVKVLGQKAKDVKDKFIAWWKYRKKFRDKSNEEHTLFFEGSRTNPILMMQSVKKQVREHINEYKKDPTTRTKALEAEAAFEVFVQAKALTMKAGKTTKDEKNSSNNLIKAVNDLSKKLRELPGNFVPTDYPKGSDVKFTSDGDRPKNVTMHYLTDQVAYGSPPGSGANVTGWPKVQSLGLTGAGNSDPWIQFHLINDNLGGLGNPNNLVPTPNSSNANYRKFENNVHRMVFNTVKRGENKNKPNEKNVVWMHVRVIYHKGDAEPFAKEIHANSGIYHYRPKEGATDFKDKWILDTKPVFQSNIEVPNPLLYEKGLNLGKSGRQHIREFLDSKGVTYSTALINAMVEQRPFETKDQFRQKMSEALLNKRIDANIANATEDQLIAKLNSFTRFFTNDLYVK